MLNFIQNSFFTLFGRSHITLDNLLTGSDYKLMSVLEQNIDKLHRDEAGLDPFHARDRKSLGQVTLNIRELLSQFNICGDNTEKFNWTELMQHEALDIPPVVHFTWLGSALVDHDPKRKEMKENIETWRNQNPHLPIIIWTDQTNKQATDLTPFMHDMKDWCQMNNIALINVDDVFAGKMLREALYLLELHLGNFGAASDIFRLILLWHFGGTCSDIDIRCLAKLNLKSKTGFKIDGEGHKDEETERHRLSILCNDVLQSVPQQIIVKELLDSIAQNYNKQLVDIFTKGINCSLIQVGNPTVYNAALGLEDFEYRRGVFIKNFKLQQGNYVVNQLLKEVDLESMSKCLKISN